jgi:hypothetical protein
LHSFLAPRPQAYFDAAATHIQRHWRGHWSRTRLHDFRTRRAYLAAAAAASAAARAEGAAVAAAARSAAEAAREGGARGAFEAQVARLHHLASTAAVPGIFSAPFEAAAGLVPLVEGLTIEERLRRASKARVRARGARRTRAGARGGGERGRPCGGGRLRGTLTPGLPSGDRRRGPRCSGG